MAGKKDLANGGFTGQVWKLTAVLLFGIVALEVMLEVGFSTSLTGTSKGPFIKSEKSHPGVKVVDIPLKQYMVVVNATTLRSRPSLKADKVGTLAVGATLKTIAMTTVGDGDVWYQTVRFGGKIGYVNGADVRRE